MKLDKLLLENLYSQNKSYKEISEITGYNINSVNGYFWKQKGKMIDDRLYRRNNIIISEEQQQILFGTLLGDGNIQKQHVNSYLGRYNHSLSQEIYCKYLKQKLDSLTSIVRYSQVENKKNNKVYQTCYFCLKNNYNLKQFYELFYIKENGKKDVPFDLTLLTPLAMAYWFMDDGTKSGGCSISIATCSFSIEGLLRLKMFLKETYNIEITIQKDFKIYFKADSARIFYNLTKDYIIPEMMYKFDFINPLLI